jgi:hypothetical protein
MQYVVNGIAVLIVALIVFWAIQFSNSPVHGDIMHSVRHAFDGVGKFIDTKKRNIILETSPTRNAPVTFIAKESQLRNFLPTVFGKFSSEEWSQFWALFYAPVEEKGAYGAKRYRTKEEIESYLKNTYYDPFSYFKDQHWQSFWSIIDIDLSAEEGRS